MQLALAHGYSCALHADGAVSCWGSNHKLQLGIQARMDYPSPVLSRPASDAIQIAAYDNRTCALHADGAVSCWGSFDGSKDGTERADSTSITGEPVAQLSDGCLRLRSGGIRCWTQSGTLADITGIAGARDVAGGDDAGCAIVGDGEVACWGDLAYRRGLVMQPSLWPLNDERRAAVRIAGVSGAAKLAVGRYYACAVLRDHQVRCWGVLYHSSSIPVLSRGGPPKAQKTMRPAQLIRPQLIAGLGDVVSVAAAGSHACALHSDGTVQCWGRMPYHEKLEDGRFVPSPVAGLRGVTAIAASRTAHMCALRGGREIACWGTDSNGELGNGWTHARTVPTDVPGLSDAVALSSLKGDSHCALRRSGRFACWGTSTVDSKYHHRSRPFSSGGEVVDVVELPPLADITGLPVDTAGNVWQQDVSARWAKLPFPASTTAPGACAITRDRQVWCAEWESSTSTVSARVVSGISDAVSVARSSYHRCVLRATGAITCLLDCPRSMDDRPGCAGDRPQIDVPVISDAIHLAIGTTEGCAVRKDRSVWCWKWKLSDDGRSPPWPAESPAPVGVADVRAVDIDESFKCALRMNGQVVCWGTNRLGQLGNGTLRDSAAPGPVVGLEDAIAISLSDMHACALRRTGVVSCWGDTAGGSVGSFATNWVEPPVAVLWP